MSKYKILYTSLYEASVTSLHISALPREYWHRSVFFRCYVSLQWETTTCNTSSWHNCICVTVLCFLDLRVQISLSYHYACVRTKVGRISHLNILWTHFKWWIVCHISAPLWKNFCALEDEDVRLRLTTNCSKHSPWVGKTHSDTYETSTRS